MHVQTATQHKLLATQDIFAIPKLKRPKGSSTRPLIMNSTRTNLEICNLSVYGFLAIIRP